MQWALAKLLRRIRRVSPLVLLLHWVFGSECDVDYHCFNRALIVRRIFESDRRCFWSLRPERLPVLCHGGSRASVFNLSLLALPPLRAIGVLLVFAGSFILMDSFARFALKGLGAPAPVFPPRHLVVNGLYRYVRNPMYVAVVSVIIGQGFFFGNLRVLEYGVVVWFCFQLFVLGYEQPTLRAKFGAEYEDFCAHPPLDSASATVAGKVSIDSPVRKVHQAAQNGVDSRFVA
jgi:protein-S-isoprenylcysteine O-methyltransferase Ste14